MNARWKTECWLCLESVLNGCRTITTKVMHSKSVCLASFSCHKFFLNFYHVSKPHKRIFLEVALILRKTSQMAL